MIAPHNLALVFNAKDGEKRHLVYCADAGKSDRGIGRSYFGPHVGADVDVTILPRPSSAWKSLLKLDVEGAERELFADPVIASYDHLVMEWHNFDGALYATILRMHGFKVTTLTGCDGTPWNPTLAGGYLRAHRG